MSERREVERALAQQRAQERGAQQRQIAGAPGVAAEFGVFAPGHVAPVVIAALDRPVAAAAGQPLLAGKRTALRRTDEEPGFAAGGAGLLVGYFAGDRDDRGGVGEAELGGRDGGERQLAAFDAAVVAVDGEKRGAWPATACAAAACTAGVLPLS